MEQARPRLDGSFSVREKVLQAAKAFVNALERSGVGKAQKSRRAERFTGDKSDVSFFEQEFGEFSAGFCERILAIAKVCGNVWKRVERSGGPLATDSGDCAQTFDDAFTAFGVFREHRGHGVHGAAHRFKRGILRDGSRIRSGLALNLDNRLNEGLGSKSVADAPAGHGESFRDGANDDDVLF